MEQQKKVIRIIGFQGASRKYHQYLGEDPLIIFGHVGIQFEDDPIIYGFHPAQESITAIGGIEDFLSLMKSRKPVRGIFQDDTHIFQKAYALAANRPSELVKNESLRLLVYVMNFEFDEKRYAAIYDELRTWYNQKQERDYLLSPINETDNFDNCATVQRHLGIPVPAFEEHEGDMGLYILVFNEEGELWRPE